jgi:hypothetical protein
MTGSQFPVAAHHRLMNDGEVSAENGTLHTGTDGHSWGASRRSSVRIGAPPRAAASSR